MLEDEIEDVLSGSSDLDGTYNIDSDSDSDSLMCECPICGEFFSSGVIEVRILLVHTILYRNTRVDAMELFIPPIQPKDRNPFQDLVIIRKL